MRKVTSSTELRTLAATRRGVAARGRDLLEMAVWYVLLTVCSARLSGYLLFFTGFELSSSTSFITVVAAARWPAAS